MLEGGLSLLQPPVAWSGLHHPLRHLTTTGLFSSPLAMPSAHGEKGVNTVGFGNKHNYNEALYDRCSFFFWLHRFLTDGGPFFFPNIVGTPICVF